MDANSLSKLERSVECDICHDPIDEPRVLPCLHTYCRCCIDDLLKFNESGNATVKCPKNCVGETVIGLHETTKILQKNYALLSVLDIIKEFKLSQPNYKPITCSCKSEVSKWCISCKIMLCDDCLKNHACENNTSFLNGKYDDVNETFQPLCEQHDAKIQHVCLNCNGCFICIYCVKREHNSHNVETLENAAKNYKEDYLEKIDNTNHVDSQFSYKDVVAEINKFEEKLTLELNARILQKVSSFIKMITKQKDDILSEYKQAVDRYVKSLNQLDMINQTFKQCLDSAKDQLEKLSAFETLATKNQLTNQRENINELKQFKVSLTNGVDDASLGILQTQQLTKNFTKGCAAFENKINEEIADNFIEMWYDGSLVMNELQKTFKETKRQEAPGLRFYLSKEKHILNYSVTDIDGIIINNDIQALKKILFLASKIIENNLSRFVFHSIQHGKPDALHLLLKLFFNGANGYYNNTTQLFHAVSTRNTQCVNILLKNGANVNGADHNGHTALHHASRKGDHEILNILLQNGAQVDHQDGNYRRTPLFEAIKGASKECVILLLKNNADVNQKDCHGHTCLNNCYDPEIIKILIENGAVH